MQNPANQQTVACPKCGHEVKLTESLAAPLIAEVKRSYEEQLRQQQDSMTAREQQVNERAAMVERQAAEAERSIATQVQSRLEAERKQMVAQEAERARQRPAVPFRRGRPPSPPRLLTGPGTIRLSNEPARADGARAWVRGEVGR